MKPCCQQEANHQVEELSEGFICRICVCGAKHYELTVDPLIVGITGEDL